MACALASHAVNPQDLTIYINPGHGGHDSDDRNVVIYPYTQGDPEGFWESNSNLDKGLFLRDMLQAKAMTVHMSRVTNTSADDLNMS
ncbi:MAG: N-acetylmuramoyl-L-alanine amidase, partial [Muribaculaceae bacterium]|nr:N-acetylmuramoyl-L-alanine amidase [Muribaculaceae bacterium]